MAQQRKSMKIIIVGSGIAGLSTYLFLQKYCAPLIDLEITIYESYRPGSKRSLAEATFQELSSSSQIAGGGLGLSPNGMRILRELDGDLHDRVEKAGFVTEKFVFKSARGWRLNVSPASDMRGKRGNPPGEEEFCLSVSRQMVRDTILEAVGPKNIVYKKVTEAKQAVPSERKKAAVVLEDGSEDEADLVIGADGVRSVVLRGVFGDEEMAKPHYEGLIGVGGFIDGPIPEEIKREKSMCFVFGANGFFGYGATSLNNLMWWSTCQAEDIPAQRIITPEEMKDQLKARHGSWNDPIIKDVIEKTAVTQIYPVWTIGELPLWGADGLVTIGDAAHALQPTSGQGSSQALEDAKCLPLLLSKFLEIGIREPGKLSLEEVIALSTKGLYEIRKPRVQKIADRTKLMAQRKKDQSFLQEMMLCFFLWLMGKVPAIGKALIGDVPKELYYWDMETEINNVVGNLN